MTPPAWEISRQKLAGLLRDNPDLAALWDALPDEGEVPDELLGRARSGEFSRKAYAAFYGDTGCHWRTG